MATRIVDVASRDELAAAIDPMVGAAHGGALILIGGADFTEPAELAAIRTLFRHLAAHCEQARLTVVDGGTDSGVMRLIAEARAAVAGTFPLIGVAPRGAFDRTTRAGAAIEPARDHDLIVRVPGDRFGDETTWLFAAADDLHHGLAPALVVNGGQLARHEADRRLAEGGVVIAVEGSGRAADDLAADLAAARAGDPGLHPSRRLRTIPIGVDAAGLAAALEGGA